MGTVPGQARYFFTRTAAAARKSPACPSESSETFSRGKHQGLGRRVRREIGAVYRGLAHSRFMEQPGVGQEPPRPFPALLYPIIGMIHDRNLIKFASGGRVYASDKSIILITITGL